MKLYASLKNERGGKKSTSDNTRIQVELSYKNKLLGTVGLYRVFNHEIDYGYRIIWYPTNKPQRVIDEIDTSTHSS